MSSPDKYPLIFSLRELVFGNGYVAEVVARGRVLAEDEGDGWWFYGVNPGGLAAGERSLILAHQAFRQSLAKVLFDLAEEAASFEHFQSLVEAFFRDTNEPTAVEWTEAVARVRAGQVKLDELDRVSAEVPVMVTVERKTNQSASDNKVDDQTSVAA